MEQEDDWKKYVVTGKHFRTIPIGARKWNTVMCARCGKEKAVPVPKQRYCSISCSQLGIAKKEESVVE